MSSGDYLFGKATCASIRHFMPEVPIAVLLDGDVDTTALERTYQNIQVIRKSDIDHPWLRENSFGWGITKMLAFWYSPFDHFLYLDSDTVVWGDLKESLPWSQFDYITDIPSKATASAVEHVQTWFFEPDTLEREFPQFPWRNYVDQYACTGTFTARKNLFDVDEYRELLEFNDKHPQTFKFGEMGLLNFMIFRKHHESAINLGFEDFQSIFPELEKSELSKRFSFSESLPLLNSGDVQVLHMPDQKPLVENENCYSLPMTYFRLKYLEDAEGLTGEAAMQKLQIEDKQFIKKRKSKKNTARFRKVQRLLSLHPGEWRYFYQNYLVRA